MSRQILPGAAARAPVGSLGPPVPVLHHAPPGEDEVGVAPGDVARPPVPPVVLARPRQPGQLPQLSTENNRERVARITAAWVASIS